MHHFLIIFCFFVFTRSFGQYSVGQHVAPHEKIVPVSKPGTYAETGTTYMLVNDISSPTTALFLGKDVTLDLNGYTIRYADAPYQHIPNSGFEEGEKGWDLSRAPGARVVSAKDVHVFIGKKIMRLKKGDEIVSPYINLPVANRSYFAMCGVTGHDYRDMNGDLNNQMKVSVYVEDGQGRDIRVITRYGDTTMVSCPVEKRAPRLGGGFVYAHLNKLPAGKYRMRVKAETDCLIDEVDIRPAMDVGVGIVGRTFPLGHYDHLYESKPVAFFDYTDDVREATPVDSISEVNGGGTITIRNGVIENGAEGVVSWGLQSTAENIKIVLDNVKFVTSGINTTAVDVPQATITNCRFEVDNPFLINRHGASFYAVDLRGPAASEVSFSDFYGGQGCLVFKGKNSSVHHNYFVNKQMVTNHYSIMAMGDSSHIFENRIEPEVGSGIEIYVHKYIEIFNNWISIKTSPPTCEYGHEEYSTAAIRMADYRAKPGAPNGCYGNRVYNNTIHVTADAQDGVSSYMPMAWAIYYSASGGDNEVFGNHIVVDKPDPDARALSTAFYICGGDTGYGGKFYNNTITTNVPAAWIGTLYGSAVNSKIFRNTIIKSSDAPPDFKPFRIGWSKNNDIIARDIEFRSNEFKSCTFSVESSDANNSYSVYWTIALTVTDKNAKPLVNALVNISNNNNKIVFSGVTDAKGSLLAELPQYSFENSEKIVYSPYEIKIGNTRAQVTLDRNVRVRIVSEK